MAESDGSNLDCNRGESGTISPYGSGNRATDWYGKRNQHAKAYVNSGVDISTTPPTHIDKESRNAAIDAHNIAGYISSRTNSRGR